MQKIIAIITNILNGIVIAPEIYTLPDATKYDDTNPFIAINTIENINILE